MTTMDADTTIVEERYVMGPNNKGIGTLAGLPEIPCIFCRNYKTQIGFDLALHLQECHKTDLIKKLRIGKGHSIEDRADYAIELAKEGK
jgi:hypothetical protein